MDSKTALPTVNGVMDDVHSLRSEDVRAALDQAYQFAKDTVRPDGHWYTSPHTRYPSSQYPSSLTISPNRCGELKSNCTITAEYVFLRQSLQLPFDNDRQSLIQYLLSEQGKDGAWRIAPDHPGEISTSVESYLALKILGLPKTDPNMQKARDWIVNVGGGIEKVRVFTRIYLAQFGLFDWDCVPQLPAELIFLPSWAPINIYRFSSWARSTIIPLVVVCHHRPIFPLPNGRDAHNDFLDELWADPSNRAVSYHKNAWTMLKGLDYVGLGFTAVDKTLSFLGGLRSYNPLRTVALDRCIQWIISRQEQSGDWAGIFPPMHLGILAYVLQGYSIDDAPVRRALEAIERFAWQDATGKRMQACVSPVWDTVLMSVGLSGAPAVPSDVVALRRRALEWVKGYQLLGSEGDWRVYRPNLTPGGFSFEYYNTWYADIDDTCAAILAFLKDDANAASTAVVSDAIKWVLGMQCNDGGWAAFDVDNDKLFLNRIPFSDMDSLCDPPTADIVGRVLEAFGLFLLKAHATKADVDGPINSLAVRVQKASRRGIEWLARNQERNGAWYGRWGVNYLYGTSNVLAGLAYFTFQDEGRDPEKSEPSFYDESSSLVGAMTKRALHFLLSMHREDGGWGECLTTYKSCGPADANSKSLNYFSEKYTQPSTASQTAWALIGLLPYLPTKHEAVRSGIEWLVRHQQVQEIGACTSWSQRRDSGYEAGPEKPFVNRGRTWNSDLYTGTGFPNHFYLGYTFYSHYFPMMALAEWLRWREMEEQGARSGCIQL
jgi:squalene-hopene/tetraprenyl-beta-curcumene cyclase